jgi:hypothetical protein
MRKRVVMLCLAAALVLPLGGAASAAQARDDDPCTWGASSVVADLKDGEVVVTEPETSGCIP